MRLAFFMMLLFTSVVARSQCTAGSVCLMPPGDQTVMQNSGTTLSVTTGNFAAQVGNQIYHAELFPAISGDPCSQIKAAIAALPTTPTSTSGGIVDARGFLSSVTDANRAC